MMLEYDFAQKIQKSYFENEKLDFYRWLLMNRSDWTVWQREGFPGWANKVG